MLKTSAFLGSGHDVKARISHIISSSVPKVDVSKVGQKTKLGNLKSGPSDRHVERVRSTQGWHCDFGSSSWY